MTPEICSKYYDSCSAACRKYQKQLGTYFHLIWSCPLIQIFWFTVQTEIENFLGIKIRMDPKQPRALAWSNCKIVKYHVVCCSPFDPAGLA